MESYPLTPLEPREHDIQGSILVYLAWDNRVAWAHRFNIGAHAITTTDPAGQVKRRFVRYAFPGCADILGQLVTGHFLAIEVKRRGGCVRPLQRAFLEQVRRGGGLALLARSIPEVQAGLDHFLGSRAAWVGTYPLPPEPFRGAGGAVSPSAIWGGAGPDLVNPTGQNLSSDVTLCPRRFRLAAAQAQGRDRRSARTWAPVVEIPPFGVSPCSTETGPPQPPIVRRSAPERRGDVTAPAPRRHDARTSTCRGLSDAPHHPPPLRDRLDQGTARHTLAATFPWLARHVRRRCDCGQCPDPRPRLTPIQGPRHRQSPLRAVLPCPRPQSAAHLRLVARGARARETAVRRSENGHSSEGCRPRTGLSAASRKRKSG